MERSPTAALAFQLYAIREALQNRFGHRGETRAKGLPPPGYAASTGTRAARVDTSARPSSDAADDWLSSATPDKIPAMRALAPDF